MRYYYLITFSFLKNCPTFFKRKNLINIFWNAELTRSSEITSFQDFYDMKDSLKKQISKNLTDSELDTVSIINYILVGVEEN